MKSFIIRLKDNSLSSSIANECVTQAKKFNLDIDYFDAFDGNAATNYLEKEKIFQYPKKLKHATGGVKGCFASHYFLWNLCVVENVPLLILEHDAFMIRPLPANILENFQDVCKLDSCNPFSDMYDSQVSEDFGNNVIDYDLSWGYKKKAAPYGGYFRGAWSYIIKPHAADIIIRQVKNNGWVPADKQFGESILKLQCTQSTIFRIHKKYNHSNIQELSLTRK